MSHRVSNRALKAVLAVVFVAAFYISSPRSTDANVLPFAHTVSSATTHHNTNGLASIPATSSVVSTGETAPGPYNLTTLGVASDLSSLGYSMQSLDARYISVLGHNGPIPKRCHTNGTPGLWTAEGLAVRNVNYRACNDGSPPLFEAYSVETAACTVVYNRQSPKKLAILAHELAHCFYHDYGNYDAFDTAYNTLRDTHHISHQGIKELIADDFMICQHGLDTNWIGDANYYTRYKVSKPSPETCTAFNALVDTYLL